MYQGNRSMTTSFTARDLVTGGALVVTEDDTVDDTVDGTDATISGAAFESEETLRLDTDVATDVTISSATGGNACSCERGDVFFPPKNPFFQPSFVDDTADEVRLT